MIQFRKYTNLEQHYNVRLTYGNEQKPIRGVLLIITARRYHRKIDRKLFICMYTYSVGAFK